MKNCIKIYIILSKIWKYVLELNYQKEPWPFYIFVNFVFRWERESMRSFLGKTNLSITLLNKYIINHNMIIICIHIFHCVNDIINEIDTQCLSRLSQILYLSLSTNCTLNSNHHNSQSVTYNRKRSLSHISIKKCARRFQL